MSTFKTHFLLSTFVDRLKLQEIIYYCLNSLISTISSFIISLDKLAIRHLIPFPFHLITSSFFHTFLTVKQLLL